LIRGSVSELLDDLKLLQDILGDTSIFDDKLSLILEKANILQSHIEAMMSLCRNGTLDTKTGLVDVRRWSRAILDIAEGIARRNGNRVEYHCRCKVSGFCTDQYRLTQAVLGILSNAGEHTKNGVISLKLDCTKSALRIEVADTGKGIPEEILGKIFEPFVKGQDDDDSKDQGIGMGLYIVKRCVEALGGTIEVKSVPGVGTRFIILAPPLKDAIQEDYRLARTVDASPP